MRNYNSKKYIALKKLSFEFKWFLTGTPIVNRIEDIGSLIHLIKKSVSPKTIQTEFAMEWMSENALQRTIEQVRTSLPGVLPPTVVHNYHRLDFISEEEAIFYRGIQGHISDALENIMAQDRMDMIMFLAMITRLRQLSTHPQVYIQSRRRQLGKSYLRRDWVSDSTKTEAIVKILEKETKPRGYVIFCHFNDEIDIIQKRLEKEGHNIFIYNGDLTTSQRTDVIEKTKKSMTRLQPAYILDEFKHLPQLPTDILDYVIGPLVGHKHTILLAQIQSAGTGLNLQHMDRVIFTSPWWTAALMDQAVGRLVRMGQKSEVHVHHISLKEEELSINIDDYINERVEVKRELCLELLLSANHLIE
jgi:SNF2 family DNA or RNA helicase